MGDEETRQLTQENGVWLMALAMLLIAKGYITFDEMDLSRRCQLLSQGKDADYYLSLLKASLK